MTVFDPFLVALLVYAPAFIANGAPVAVKNMPLLRQWSTPIAADALGANKTWRGLVCGIIAAVLTGLGLFLFGSWEGEFSIFLHGFSLVGFLSFSAWMGFAALFGDILKSYVKRKKHLPPWARWMPWDGIDYVLAALLFGLPFFVPSISQAVFILLIGPVLSGIFNVVSFLMGWKKVPY